MRTSVAQGVALLFAVTSSAACAEPPCPPGSHDEMGRCIADRDAAIDVGALDASSFEAGPVDARAPPPDACALLDLFEDRDRDGHGDAMRRVRACGVVPGVASSSDDCDDDAETVHPGATELCNGTDDDCDDGVDESIQRLLGTPRTLGSGDSAAYAVSATSVAGSYLLAWTNGANGFLARLAADGTMMSTRLSFGSLLAPELLRLVPIGDDRVAVAYASIAFTPARVFVDVVRVTDEPMTVVGTAHADYSMAPHATRLMASPTTLTVVYANSSGGMVVAAVPLPDLTPTSPVPFGRPLPVARSLHSSAEGPLVLENEGGELLAFLLEPDTWTERVRAPIAAPGTSDVFASIDAAGLVTVLASEGLPLETVRFDVRALSTPPVPTVRAPLTLHEGATGSTPYVGSSMAGTDVVVEARLGAMAGLEWQHIDRSGGVVAWGNIPGATLTHAVAGSRLSSQRGAIFFLTSELGAPYGS